MDAFLEEIRRKEIRRAEAPGRQLTNSFLPNDYCKTALREWARYRKAGVQRSARIICLLARAAIDGIPRSTPTTSARTSSTKTKPSNAAHSVALAGRRHTRMT
jgi:hypothetical protein